MYIIVFLGKGKVLQYILIKGAPKGDEKKPMMLFVHGFPDFWFVWRNQMQHFAKDFWYLILKR